MTLNPALFGPPHPSDNVYLALVAAPTAAMVAWRGFDVQAIGPAVMTACLAVTVCSWYKIELARLDRLVILRDDTTTDTTPTPGAPAGWRSMAAEVGNYLPPMPDDVDKGSMVRLAYHIMLRRPLTHEAVEKEYKAMSRHPYDKARRWMTNQGYAHQVGRTNDIEITRDGRTWARRVLSIYRIGG